MNSEMVKSKSELTDSTNNDKSNNNETIDVRVSRYLEHIRHLKKQNTENMLKNREQLKKLKESKLRSAETAIQRDRETFERAMKSLVSVKDLSAERKARINAFGKTNSALNETVRNLQASVEVGHSQTNRLLNEVRRLQRELAWKIEEYRQLPQEESDNSMASEIPSLNKFLSQEKMHIKQSTSTTQLFANCSEMESQF